MQTVIFVDVDGVLNVGIRDGGGAPLLYNDSNRAFALEHGGDDECVQRLLSVEQRALPEVGGGRARAYFDLSCSRGSHVSDVLAKNLAAVVTAAGKDVTVVLSSNWRKPAHAARVRQLEAQVAAHMPSGRFVFHDTTRQADERCAADRLECIGDYMERVCLGRRGRPVRFLLLEDFFVTPMDGWRCEGQRMDSVAAAEAYLLDRAGAAARASVKLVHTYDEWRTPAGLCVQVGAGLSERYRRQALAFLAETGPSVGPASKLDAPALDTEGRSPKRSDRAFRKVFLGAGGSPTLARGAMAGLLTATVPWLAAHLPCAALA